MFHVKKATQKHMRAFLCADLENIYEFRESEFRKEAKRSRIWRNLEN